MNETFSIKRFGAYFKFDIARMWHKHGKALIMFSLIGVMLYFVTAFFSLLFGKGWSAPSFEARTAVFFIVCLIVELYMTRLYGYITKKHEGSDWILLPASKGEKYVSMLIQALIIVPVGVFGAYLFADWLLCCIDHGCGQSLITGYSDYVKVNIGGEDLIEMAKIGLSPVGLVLLTLLGNIVNYLFFLLCGICFKKNKIVFAFLILFALSVVTSTLMAIAVPFLNYEGMVDMDETSALAMVKGIFKVVYIFIGILAVGLGWGVWRRISTIKH